MCLNNENYCKNIAKEKIFSYYMFSLIIKKIDKLIYTCKYYLGGFMRKNVHRLIKIGGSLLITTIIVLNTDVINNNSVFANDKIVNKNDDIKTKIQNTENELNELVIKSDIISKKLGDLDKQINEKNFQINNIESSIAEDEKILKLSKDEIEKSIKSEEEKIEFYQSEITRLEKLLLDKSSKDNIDGYKNRIREIDNQINEIKLKITNIEHNKSLSIIPVDDEYIVALKKYAEINGTDGKEELTKTLIKHSYKDLVWEASEEDKKRSISLENLKQNDKDEINEFAIKNINAIRRKFGYSDVRLTEGVKNFSEDVFKQYSNKKDTRTYLSGHDNEILNSTATKHGLRSTTGGQLYEDLYSATGTNITIDNMGKAKEAVIQAVVGFLYNNEEWEHAKSITGVFHASSKQYDMHTGFSLMKNGFEFHVIGVPDNYILDKSKYSTTLVNSKLNSNSEENDQEVQLERQKIIELEKEKKELEKKIKSDNGARSRSRRSLDNNLSSNEIREKIDNYKKGIIEAKEIIQKLKEALKKFEENRLKVIQRLEKSKKDLILLKDELIKLNEERKVTQNIYNRLDDSRKEMLKTLNEFKKGSNESLNPKENIGGINVDIIKNTINKNSMIDNSKELSSKIESTLVKNLNTRLILDNNSNQKEEIKISDSNKSSDKKALPKTSTPFGAAYIVSLLTLLGGLVLKIYRND